MAELIKPYLYYKPAIMTNPDQLLTTYRIGKDVDFQAIRLTCHFRGIKWIC